MSVGGSEKELAGVYVHIPFCSFVCPYCDFAVKRLEAGEIDSFTKTLITEIAHSPGQGQAVDTIYFGGGTPSVLSIESVVRIVRALNDRFDLSSSCKIHMEVNPEDVTESYLSELKDAGVKFLSLGIQSFDDDDLKFLGRRHNGAEAKRAMDVAQHVGFETLSVDLIFGLPQQVNQAWLSQVDYLAVSGVHHVSCYQLNVKPGTLFSKRAALGRFHELSDDGQGVFFEEVHGRMSALGFEAYEVSNFARASRHQSKHNKKYWGHIPYWGFGPSAHSFNGRDRFWNHGSLVAWSEQVHLLGNGIEERETLSRHDVALEVIMLSLRRTTGLDLDNFYQRFDVDLAAEAGDVIAKHEDAGLLLKKRGVLRPTVSGLAVADAMALDLSYFL